jgi:RNA polymerase sigma-70 factor (sigma-E family)
VREPEGFREFVVARYPALVRIGASLAGDVGHGEDLVQVALVKTFRAWSRLYPDGDPEAYTRRIMVRAAWRAHRRHWRHEVSTANLPETAAQDVFQPLLDADALQHLLAGLPAQQRVVLTLRYLLGQSEADIAAQLGCSPGTVKSRASRALATLRAAGALESEHLTNGADR